MKTEKIYVTWLLFTIFLLSVTEASAQTYKKTFTFEYAKSVGSLGVMSKLTRTRCGIFTMENGISVEDLKNSENIEKYIIAPDKAVSFEKLNLTSGQAQKILDGVYENYGFADGVYRVYNQDAFIGVGKVENGILRINSYVR